MENLIELVIQASQTRPGRSRSSVQHTFHVFGGFGEWLCKGGHSYITRRTVRDRGQDAVKRSSRILALVKRSRGLSGSVNGQGQLSPMINSYPTGYTHDLTRSYRRMRSSKLYLRTRKQS